MSALEWIKPYFPEHNLEILKLIVPMSPNYIELDSFYLQVEPDKNGRHKLLAEYDAYPDPEDDGLIELIEEENANILFKIDPAKIIYCGVVDDSGKNGEKDLLDYIAEFYDYFKSNPPK